ncbi:MAG: uridine kinase [Sphingobacteriales bacterium]|nr:MAG: uridine kinase [Sphingobacteriales bacterium]TAF79168.1 MAG: uridine kinase [Sphingobacteriales bacterium]
MAYPPTKNKPYVVGVAGGSGSGKTVFLNSFLAHFEPQQVCLISQDDYYKKISVEMTVEENRNYNFDLPECIETHQFEQDLVDLLAYKAVYKQAYTFNNPLLTPQILEIKPAPIIIIEGLFIYHYANINPLIDFRIFMDAEESIALERRLKRDLVERGYSAEDVLYKWTHHVMPSFNAYLLPHRNTCHKIIPNSNNQIEHIFAQSLQIALELKAQLYKL